MSDSDKSGANIFLVGFMGNGKTHWGKLWAAESGHEFFDLDHVIEKEEQKTIAAIFEQNGEAYFREKETETLKTFANKTNCIIACGGGTPCFNNNMQWMNEHGTTVYLAATPADIFKRVIGEQTKRPLIKNLSAGDLMRFIEKKLQERAPVYNTAKIILPVTEINAATINSLL
ncbi:shikimate kinase [Ferruginibacter profundus]